MRLEEDKVFKDPIHQYIYVQDSIIWRLINTKEFQKLRRVKQLGTTYFTFHGAEHSRFSHSLGVYEITRKIISDFEKNQTWNWAKEERLIALIAAILHDVGHGPFSHSIEGVFNTNHEEWSKKIIMGDTEINKVLVEVDNQLPNYISDVLDKKSIYPVIEDIISSQLDADRMDYLLRDAYYTGVNYGTFDLERILRVLRIYDNRLVVKESGMHSVEDYLMSRYQMYWQVYFHPVTRSGEVLLRKIFSRAKELFHNDYKFNYLFSSVENLFRGELGIEDYFWLDDSFIFTLFNLWTKEKDIILADLTSRFINRRLFHYVDYEPIEQEKLEKIKELFRVNNINPEYYLEIDSPSDLPYDIYPLNDESNKAPIFLLKPNGSIVEISKESEIIASMTGRKKAKHRLYYPLDLLRENQIEGQFNQIFIYFKKV